MTDFKKYMYYKLIQSMVSDDELIRLVSNYNEIVLTEDFIKCLNIFSGLHIIENELDENELNRFLRLINYIRDNIDNIDKYNKLINELIVSANMSNCSNSNEYCVNNYLMRFYRNKLYKNVRDPQMVVLLIQKIKKSISNDYFVLTIMTSPHQESFDEMLNLLVLDEYFLISVNQIIAEFPDILDSQIFINRLKIVVDENIKRIKHVKNNKKRKMIYRRSKFYAKYLKEE